MKKVKKHKPEYAELKELGFLYIGYRVTKCQTVRIYRIIKRDKKNRNKSIS